MAAPPSHESKWKRRVTLQAIAQTSINLKSRRQSDHRLIVNFELVKRPGPGRCGDARPRRKTWRRHW